MTEHAASIVHGAPKPPLTGYPLPDDAYTDDPSHIGCMLPAIRIAPEWGAPTRRAGMLPVGTRWQCAECQAIYVVVDGAPSRAWEREKP